MKLWIIIYLAGELVGSVGPLPYGPDECEKRIAEKMAEANHDVVTPGGFTTKDVRLACEYRDARPRLSEGAPLK